LLKRISTSDLRIGMFVEEFCGSWMDHPFWRARFLIMDTAQLERIRDSGVTEVWIDSSKGLDVDAPKAKVENRDAANAKIERELKGVAADAARQRNRAANLDGELERASKIIRESRRVVLDMFGEARMGSVRSLAGADRVVDAITDSVQRHPSAVVGLARLKTADSYTFMHSMAVCALMTSLARTLDFSEDEVKVAAMAGLLHDVGKAQIPTSIINKTGTLDDQEWDLMRSHPERGFTMLEGTDGVTPEIRDAVIHHHEKMDGSGYPHKLKGDQISLLARMNAVCDVYDAITSDRAYKPGWQPTVAIRKMTEWVGHFDDKIFKAFVRTVGIYPVGSLVRLKSQRLAVVVDHDPAHLLQPTVKAFFSLKSKMYVQPVLVNLVKDDGERIVGIEDPEALGITRIDELWVPPSAAIAA